MEVTLTGAVGWTFTIFVGGTAIALFGIGAVWVWNYILLQLIEKVFRQFQIYHRLILFIYAYARLRARKKRHKEEGRQYPSRQQEHSTDGPNNPFRYKTDLSKWHYRENDPQKDYL